MRHNFEDWIDEQYNKREITDGIRDILNESILCHKAGAYRAAIVMVISGFNIIIKDRILKELDNLLHHLDVNNIENKNTEVIKILEEGRTENKNNWNNASEWDKILFYNLLSEKHIAKIFDVKKITNIRDEWEVWRNKRNIGAHGENYLFHYSDVESLYSWMIQILKLLYPVTHKDSLLKFIDNFFDETYTPKSANINILVEKLLSVDNVIFAEGLKKIESIAIAKYSEEKDRILKLFKILYNDKRKEIIDTIIEKLIDFILEKKDNTNMYNAKYFLTDLSYQDSYYQYLNDSDDNNKKHQLLNAISCYNLVIIDCFFKQGCKDWTIKKINEYDLDIEIPTISPELLEIINNKIKERCNQLATSGSFDTANTLSRTIPYKNLTEENLKIILDAIKNNSQLSYSIDMCFFMNKYYSFFMNKYPNLDYSFIEERYSLVNK